MAVNATSNEDLKAEINVTPLVDVVLVLLIIFMVVTPMLKQEVPIDLPIAANSRSAEEAEQVTLTIALDGREAINGVEVTGDELKSRLTAMYADRADKTIFLEADRELSHGRVVEVMDDCRAAGIERIGVITKRDPKSATAPPPGGAAVKVEGLAPPQAPANGAALGIAPGASNAAAPVSGAPAPAAGAPAPGVPAGASAPAGPAAPAAQP